MTLSWQHVTYKPSKLNRTDVQLVFGYWSEFIGRSVHAGCMCSGYDVHHPGYHACTQAALTGCTISSTSWDKNLWTEHIRKKPS